jgi:hypothetical protein
MIIDHADTCAGCEKHLNSDDAQNIKDVASRQATKIIKMSAKRRTSSKSGLTLLLEELTTLLPKALEACPADSESQSSNLVIEKLRSVLLDLLDNCLKCSSGQDSRCMQQHAQHASLQLHM